MKYRYFRRSNGHLYKLSGDDDSLSNLRSPDGGQTWYSTCYLLSEFLDPEYWGREGQPVEYFPDTEPPNTKQPDTKQPSYRYFRRANGEWKVQTADPESHEGNFYRNVETPWLTASHSLSDLLAMGATEVGASEEQMPSWAVAAVINQKDQKRYTMDLVLGVYRATTEEQALGMFMADTYKDNPGAQIQEPLIQRVP